MGRDGWWDWRADGQTKDERLAISEDQKKAAFNELMERCVVVDSLAANVTPHTVRTALGQFGTVLGVKMLINPQDMQFVGVAIAEMACKDHRDQVVRELREYLFMVGAMPRPARAMPANACMLLDHPWRRNPNMIRPRLVSRRDPDAKLIAERELKDRLKLDDDALLQQYMEQEEIKLARAQESTCQEHMEKLNLIAKEQKAGTIREVKKLHGLYQR